jgi:Bacterial SNF2 helicase associated.
MRELMLTKETVKELYYDNSFRFDDYWAFSGKPAKITSVNENADGSVQIKGTVKSFRYNQAQTVSVAINPEKGLILSTSCSCFKLQKKSISKDSAVVCSHVKALLDEFIDGCEEMRWPYKPKQYSSDCLTRSLNAAQRQIENAAVKTEIDTEGSDLNLSFSFGFGDNGNSVQGASFYASLQVAGAKTRKFVVKDLRQFIDGLWSHSRITFGKDTEFLLNWDKLNANDRTIIETISSSMVRTNKLSGLEKKPNGKFLMTEAGFVRTVRFFHDNEIPFVFDGLESTISYDYPKLVLLIRKANWDSVRLNFCSGDNEETGVCTFGNSVAFFDSANRVFHLPEVDYATRMIFSMFGEDRIQMASADFIPFCQNMLPLIQKFATVEGLENLGEVKLPQKPRFKLYLDSDPSRFFLIGRPTAVYDEGEIDIIANKDCSFQRNDMEERRFIKVCAHAMNGFIIDKEKCIHAHFGNEDEYYSFLANISDIIAPYGDAMVSPDLSSNMPVRPSFSFASGLSSSGSMLLDVKVEQEVLDQLGEIISAYKLKNAISR